MWRPITQIGDVIGVPDYSSPLDSEDESIGFRLALLALRVLLLRREPGRDPIVVRMVIEPVQQQHAALGRVLRLAPLRGFVALLQLAVLLLVGKLAPCGCTPLAARAFVGLGWHLLNGFGVVRVLNPMAPLGYLARS